MLDRKALDTLFTEAHTHNGWLDKAVADDLLRRLWDLVKMAPTSANCLPSRIVFVRTKEGKEKLKPALSAGNLDKTMAAPVCAIIGYDLEFFELLPRLYPQADMKKNFVGNPEAAKTAAFRNGSMQGGYFILAARALGLDCGPMSGYDNAKVDEAFFPGGKVKSNFLCNIGYGDAAKIRPRNPRLGFDEACTLA